MTEPLPRQTGRHPKPFHTPIEAMLGDPTQCRKFTEDVAVHWFPKGAQRGDRCLCGETTKGRPDAA